MEIPRLATAFTALTLTLATIPAEFAAPGDLDPLDLGISSGYVFAEAVQPDGKIIIGGRFGSVLGVLRRNLARLNADGTLDLGFNPNPNGDIYCVAVQSDGKVLLGGYFTSLAANGSASTTRRFIARVNTDGTLDTGFDPRASNGVVCMALQGDGKILVGGPFTTFQPNLLLAPISRQHTARVNVDGTLDMGFDPNTNTSVDGVAVQPDGKVLLIGSFTTLQPNGAAMPTARQSIARVNMDGSLDMDFDPKPNGAVYCIAVQGDGKALIGGAFSTLQPNGATTATARGNLARLNPDGTLDMGFDVSADGVVEVFGLQADGRVLLGGGFQSLRPNGANTGTARSEIGRVNVDGTVAAGFDPSAEGGVQCMAIQADGKVVLGGEFTSFQPNGSSTLITRTHFARVFNDPATQILSVPDTTQVQWQRGGTVQEVGQVSFELSTDSGGTWTSLGAGARIGTTANWQLTALALPASGQIRARGRTTCGSANGSSGLLEQVAVFNSLTSIQSWKLAHLADANADDLADPDGDGLPTLAEYGLALLPEIRSTAPIPSVHQYAEGRRLRIFIQRDPTHNDVTVDVQAAGSLAGPWTSVATSTLGAPFTGPGYVAGEDGMAGVKTVEVRDTANVGDVGQRFMRVRVTH